MGQRAEERGHRPEAQDRGPFSTPASHSTLATAFLMGGPPPLSHRRHILQTRCYSKGMALQASKGHFYFLSFAGTCSHTQSRSPIVSGAAGMQPDVDRPNVPTQRHLQYFSLPSRGEEFNHNTASSGHDHQSDDLAPSPLRPFIPEIISADGQT